MTDSNKARKKSFSDTMRKSLTRTLTGKKSTELEGSSFLKNIIKTPRSTEGDKTSSKKRKQQESTRESTEQQMRTPPQLDEKATVPKLELSQLKQTPSTPSPADPAPPAQPVPDAPTAAASAADEPAAEPEPVINAEAPAVIAASETPTPEKSTSQAAPEAQPEVQAEAPSNAAPTRAPSSNAAPAQAPSKAANKGHRGLLRLIPALLVAGVCVVGVLQRSGSKQDRSSPSPQYRSSGRGALEVRSSSAPPSATWSGSCPSVLSAAS